MRRTIVLPLLLVLMWPARPASASCVPPEPLAARVAEAPVVFVGTVLSTANDDRVAQVRVEEVWKGPKLPDQVEVRGTQFSAQENARSSVDRTFRIAVRYLFVPRDDGDSSSAAVGTSVFDDHLCTATQEYRPDLDEFRPASVAGPTGPGDGEEQAPAAGGEGRGVLPLAAAATAALALVAAGGRRWQRRRG